VEHRQSQQARTKLILDQRSQLFVISNLSVSPRALEPTRATLEYRHLTPSLADGLNPDKQSAPSSGLPKPSIRRQRRCLKLRGVTIRSKLREEALCLANRVVDERRQQG
jgi:hypothetical protein